MKRASRKRQALPPEDSLDRYDWSRASRGRYAARFPRAAHAVVIDPQLWPHFGSGDAVNEALRTVVKMATLAAKWRPTNKPKGRRAA